MILFAGARRRVGQPKTEESGFPPPKNHDYKTLKSRNDVLSVDCGNDKLIVTAKCSSSGFSRSNGSFNLTDENLIWLGIHVGVQQSAK